MASSDGEPCPLSFISSANTEPLNLYLKAELALKNYKATIKSIDFGTLAQYIYNKKGSDSREILLLMPWDFIPECDWRLGHPNVILDPLTLLKQAEKIKNILIKRNSNLFFLPSPVKPLFLDKNQQRLLQTGLLEIALGMGCYILDQRNFSLSSYLSIGSPFNGEALGEVSHAIIDHSFPKSEEIYKIVVSDLDNVMWAGVIGEDGESKIKCNPEGVGYPHFIYQNILKKLQQSGVLLSIVSRNDLDIAIQPFRKGITLFDENDFVAICASYEPKSVHIQRLSKKLNLGLDAFVFIDDNPIEITEVSKQLPQVKCLQFPKDEDDLPDFLENLTNIFTKTTITDEDLNRTKMYRIKLNSLSDDSVKYSGADLFDYLKTLKMKLSIFKSKKDDYSRAIQLINKTNQFNLNGVRYNKDKVYSIINNGGILYSVKLEDKSGSHGEILACLLNNESEVLSFVMSCRVFQRRVENVFLKWLIEKHGKKLKFLFNKTLRNSPIEEFFKGLNFDMNVSPIRYDVESLLSSLSRNQDLFIISDNSDE